MVSALWVNEQLTSPVSPSHLQSDVEKLEGLPVTPFMDRDKVTKPSSQTGFIRFVLLPLFIELANLFPCLEVTRFQNGVPFVSLWVGFKCFFIRSAATHHPSGSEGPGLLHGDGEGAGEGESELGSKWERSQDQRSGRGSSESCRWPRCCCAKRLESRCTVNFDGQNV